jgi:hypothetical protein
VRLDEALKLAIARLQGGTDANVGPTRLEEAAAVLSRFAEEYPLVRVIETLQAVRDDIREERAKSNANLPTDRTFDHMAFVWENCLSEMITRYSKATRNGWPEWASPGDGR